MKRYVPISGIDGTPVSLLIDTQTPCEQWLLPASATLSARRPMKSTLTCTQPRTYQE